MEEVSSVARNDLAKSSPYSKENHSDLSRQNRAPDTSIAAKIIKDLM
jgi:hypothetical protein